MPYLATQFIWFLIAALTLGCVIGWLSREAAAPSLTLRTFGYAALIWLGMAALSWLRTVNGVSALWLETALLFAAAYLAGCLLGNMLPSKQKAVDLAPAVAGVAPASVVAETPAPAVIDTETVLPGQKPEGLPAARSGSPDDLKLIRGVGPQNEQKLHGLGIWHFDQIAAWTPQNAEWVGGYMAFPGRIERENWIDQAKALAAGGKPES